MNDIPKLKEVPSEGFDIVRRLQLKQKELEERVYQTRSDSSADLPPNTGEQYRGHKFFKSHPDRLGSPDENDCSRVSSFSTTNVELTEFYQERKVSTRLLEIEAEIFVLNSRGTKAYSIRNKLHEKLSLTNPDDIDVDSHLDIIGDNYYSPKSYPTLKKFYLENSEIGSAPSKKESEIGSKVDITNKPSVTKRKAATAKSSKNSSLQSSHRSIFNTGVFETKYRSIVDKSLHALDEIRKALDKGITLPDGEEDETRRMVRVREFSNRFHRNYLYPLDIQLKELKDACDKEKLKLSNQVIKQKLLSAYQTILYGLQAYQNHIPSSLGNCASDKLEVLLSHTLDLYRIHTDLLRENDVTEVKEFLETFKLNIELTQQKIDELFYDTRAKSTDSVLKSNYSRISLGKYNTASKQRSKSSTKKSAMEQRLAMYNTTASFRKDVPWKMAVDNLSRKRLNIKSKYKTATYKHRPPVQKEVEVIPVNPKVVAKKSSGTIKHTPMVSPKNEDTIETMVELVVDTDRQESEKERKEPFQNDLIIKLIQLVINSGNEKENKSGRRNEELFELLDKMKEEGNGEALQKMLEDLKQNQIKGATDNQLILNIVNSKGGTADTGKRRKPPKVTSVTGEKNARLICVTDENSIVESECETATKPAPFQSQHLPNKKQTNGKKGEDNKVTKPNKNAPLGKINRVTKNGKPLKVLPKELALNVIQYKLDFYKHCKNNPMYRKTSNCQPCHLMNSVSDELLNQCLLAVAREIEINDIVDTIYQSELQC